MNRRFSGHIDYYRMVVTAKRIEIYAFTCELRILGDGVPSLECKKTRNGLQNTAAAATGLSLCCSSLDFDFKIYYNRNTPNLFV